MDGAEHTRYRAVADKYMTNERTAAIEAIEPTCQAVAAELAAEIPHGVPVDVVGGLRRRYAVRRKASGSAGRWSWRNPCCNGWPTTMRQQGSGS